MQMKSMIANDFDLIEKNVGQIKKNVTSVGFMFYLQISVKKFIRI
jgi:hypothetical protein